MTRFYESNSGVNRTHFHQKLYQANAEGLAVQADLADVKQLAGGIKANTDTIPAMQNSVSSTARLVDGMNPVVANIQATTDQIRQQCNDIPHINGKLDATSHALDSLRQGISALQGELVHLKNKMRDTHRDTEAGLHILRDVFRRAEHIDFNCLPYLRILNQLEDSHHAEHFDHKSKNKTLNTNKTHLLQIWPGLEFELNSRRISEAELERFKFDFIQAAEEYPSAREQDLIQLRMQRSLLCHSLRNRIYQYFSEPPCQTGEGA